MNTPAVFVRSVTAYVTTAEHYRRAASGARTPAAMHKAAGAAMDAAAMIPPPWPGATLAEMVCDVEGAALASELHRKAASAAAIARVSFKAWGDPLVAGTWGASEAKHKAIAEAWQAMANGAEVAPDLASL